MNTDFAKVVKKPLNLRMKVEVIRAIKLAALENGITCSDLIERLVVSHLPVRTIHEKERAM